MLSCVLQGLLGAVLLSAGLTFDCSFFNNSTLVLVGGVNGFAAEHQPATLRLTRLVSFNLSTLNFIHKESKMNLSHITVLNSNTVEILLPNVTLNDEGFIFVEDKSDTELIACIYLRVKAAPPPPTNLTCIYREQSVNCSADKGPYFGYMEDFSAFLSYTVTYSSGSKHGLVSMKHVNHLTHVWALLPEVDANALYQVRVFANNSIGSALSAEHQFRLKQISQLPPPSRLFIKNVASSVAVVDVDVEAPPFVGVVLFWFRVTIKDCAVSWSMEEPETLRVLEQQFVRKSVRLRNLAAGRKHVISVRVKGNHSEFWSPAVQRVVNLSPSVPTSAPQSLAARNLTSSTLRVTWSALLCRYHGDTAGVGYALRVRCLWPGASSNCGHRLNATDTKTAVEGLEAYRTYGLQVAARNSLGLGNWSKTLRATTFPLRFSAPEISSVTNVTNSSALVTWRDTVRLTDSLVSYRLALMHKGKLLSEMKYKATQVRVTSLLANSEYSVQVRICGTLGCSNASARFHFQTEMGYPGAPSHVRLEDAAVVRWAPVHQPGATVSYLLTWRDENGSHVRRTSNHSLRVSCVSSKPVTVFVSAVQLNLNKSQQLQGPSSFVDVQCSRGHSSSMNWSLIAGASSAAACVLLISLGFYCCCKRRRKLKRGAANLEEIVLPETEFPPTDVALVLLERPASEQYAPAGESSALMESVAQPGVPEGSSAVITSLSSSRTSGIDCADRDFRSDPEAMHATDYLLLKGSDDSQHSTHLLPENALHCAQVVPSRVFELYCYTYS